MPTVGNNSDINNPLNITTFNTEYWHSSERELLTSINWSKQDIILLQEQLAFNGKSWYPIDHRQQIKDFAKGYNVASFGEVLTLTKYPIINIKRYGEGTAIRTDLQLEDSVIISVYNVHLPAHIYLPYLSHPTKFLSNVLENKSRRSFLMDELLEDISSNLNPIIVGGDFNTSLAMNSIRRLKNSLNDSFALTHCTPTYGTWVIAPYISWRIDYIFYSKHFSNKGEYCTEPQHNISDHFQLLVKLNKPSKVQNI